MKKDLENKIIHFTDKFDTLKQILSSNTLKLSYSSEILYFKKSIISKAVHPMISFSEYNLSTINNQRITYGKYGLGFSKVWSIANNIGPVLYVGTTSIAAKGINELLNARRIENNERLSPKIRLAIMEVKTYIKNEKGFNSKLNIDNFDFKAENEWRYVPRKKEINNYFISLNQRTYLKNKSKHNIILERYPLRFKRDDIQVVFVSNQNEEDELVRHFGLAKNLIKIDKNYN